MRLSDLTLEEGTIEGADAEVEGLSLDARGVLPGDLFAALKGSRFDGRRFVGEALKNGAVAVLTGEEGPLEPLPVPVVRARDPRGALARMAARLYPKRPAFVAAVTGTNGKTSIAAFARQLWTLAGLRAASLGTLGLEGDAALDAPKLTTPDAVSLHRILEGLAGAGVGRLVLEASSHGLDQRRLEGVAFDAAAFSNLSRDHFDYHGSEAAYLTAKRRLFSDLLRPGGIAVLNADAPQFEGLAEAARARGALVWDYGFKARRLRLDAVTPHAHGQRLDLTLEGREAGVDLGLVGAFQAHNVLAALGLAVAGGLDPSRAVGLLPRLQGVRGRMELACRHPNGAPAFVDYAHTPDALEKALLALRPHAKGRLLVVFGCGGDRDPGKRPLMGGVAGRLADRVWVTDDNPRTEDPGAIRAAILAACPEGRTVEAGGRAAAILDALKTLGPDDLLLVAGKGHETGQTVGDRMLPFDDALVLRDAARLAGGAA